MTKETLQKANVLNEEIKLVARILRLLGNAKTVEITISCWDIGKVNSYDEDRISVPERMLSKMTDDFKEYKDKLEQELDAL